MKIVDCLGDMCPVPILKTKEALKKTNTGDCVKVITDHSCVNQSILDHFSIKKFTIESEEVMNGIWEIIITKN